MGEEGLGFNKPLRRSMTGGAAIRGARTSVSMGRPSRSINAGHVRGGAGRKFPWPVSSRHSLSRSRGSGGGGGGKRFVGEGSRCANVTDDSISNLFRGV